MQARRPSPPERPGPPEHLASTAVSLQGPESQPTAARRRRAGGGGRRRVGHADSRLPQVLDAAARLFCRQGYQGATVRDIALAVGMLPGSIYSHFAAKEDLLVAVYRRGVDQIIAAVEQAVRPHRAPWARLEAACIAHLEAILRDDDHARVVVRVRPAELGRAADRLVRERDPLRSAVGGADPGAAHAAGHRPTQPEAAVAGRVELVTALVPRAGPGHPASHRAPLPGPAQAGRW
jgi:AcrR family transcriptional regulator